MLFFNITALLSLNQQRLDADVECFYKLTYSLGKYENNIVDVRIACTQLKCRRIDLVLFWPMQVSHFKAFIS